MSRIKVLTANYVGTYSYKPDIEIKRYEDGKEIIEETTTECVICKRNLCEPSYETVTNNNNIFRETEITIGKCGHLFHSDCIDKWLKTCDTCPIDRVRWCRHREIDSTTRFVINNNYKNSNHNCNYNKKKYNYVKKNQIIVRIFI